MLDELLGRAELKEQLAELEAERDRLERRLDAETERRREAVRDRQDAEERINQFEDRIAGLEGELERLRGGDSGPAFHRVETLDRGRTAEVVDRLRSFRTGPEGALTAGVTDTIPEPIRELLGDRAPLADRAAPCVLCLDDALTVRVALAPPRVPAAFTNWGDRFTLDPDWFLPTGRATFALVRTDLFAMGTAEDGDLVDVEGFESEVKSRHSKGGFSQARFERLREEQIETHLDRCREALADRTADPLILVGDRRTISALDVEPAETATVDAGGKPREALSEAFRDFWRTRLYLF